MSPRIIFSISVVLGFIDVRAQAAGIAFTDPEGGSVMDLATTGEMQLRISTAAIDSINIAVVQTHLDALGMGGASASDVDVIAVTSGAPPPWEYEEVELPAILYGFFRYSIDDSESSPGYPLGDATYIHDTLTLSNTYGKTSGSIEVGFGARVYPLLGPAPSHLPFTLAPEGFPPGFPGFVYPGDDFIIHLIPEPASMTLLGLGSVCIAYRCRKRR